MHPSVMINKIIIIFVLSLSFNLSYANAQYSVHHQSIVNLFTSESEPLVGEARWESPYTLLIGLLRQRPEDKEFANYACDQIINYGLSHPSLKVRVIYLPRLMSTGNMELISETSCS